MHNPHNAEVNGLHLHCGRLAEWQLSLPDTLLTSRYLPEHTQQKGITRLIQKKKKKSLVKWEVQNLCVVLNSAISRKRVKASAPNPKYTPSLFLQVNLVTQN